MSRGPETPEATAHLDAAVDARAVLAAIIDNTSDLVWCVDPERFAIQVSNRALREYIRTGRGGELRVGATPDELLPTPELAEHWRELYRRALRELGGLFANGSVGGGWGPNMSGDVFSGVASDGTLILGGGVTAGLGVGASASAGTTWTNVSYLLGSPTTSPPPVSSPSRHSDSRLTSDTYGHLDLGHHRRRLRQLVQPDPAGLVQDGDTSRCRLASHAGQARIVWWARRGMPDASATFEAHRPELLALAYRMLGELARAQDVVQEAWIRWHRQAGVDSPKAFLITTVTRLCLDELGSARARREESRSDRLPEPVDLDQAGIGRVEMLDEISMAFLVLLQRLTPAERAVLLLHDVLDMDHAAIGALLGKSNAACRQILKRARENVSAERRVFETSQEEHRRLLRAFVQATTSGDQEALLDLLAEDAVLVADAGPGVVRYGNIRNVGRPVVGRRKVAALLKVVGGQRVGPPPLFRERILNGSPAIVVFQDGRAVSAILLSVADGRIRRIFLQVDPERLRHIGPPD